MVMYLNNQTAFVEWYPSIGQVGQEIVGYGSSTEMIYKDSHRRFVGKYTVLLIKSKVVWMHMDDQRWRASGELLQDIRGFIFHYDT